MNADAILITKRLILRPVRLGDARTIQRLFPRFSIVRYFSHLPWPYPKHGAVRFLRMTALPEMRRGLRWEWAITLKNSGDRLIGLVSLRKTGPTHRGFWLAEECHGQGLMAEAIVAVNDFAFTKAGLQKLVITQARANHASRRVKEKTLGRCVGLTRTRYVCGIRPTEVWEITRKDWLKRKR